MTADRVTGDVGSTLREARERKGVTLRQIAAATKISVAVLEGLERNDISRLPGGIFGRAFVRAFAEEVGLDPETILQQFMAQLGSEAVAAGHPSTRHTENVGSLQRHGRMALIVVGLIGLSVPFAALTVYSCLSGGRVTAPVATPIAAAEPGPSNPAPASSGPGAALTGVAPAAAEPAVSPVVDTEVRPSATDPAVDRLVISLSVSRRCWVSVKVDGAKRIQRLFKPGDSRLVEVRRDLVITMGDAGAVMMTINGTEARRLGRSGEVVTARLDLTNFSKFLPDR